MTLPYELDTEASFTVDRFNGRGLADDVMDVMLTLATNTPLSDGVAPDKSRMRDDFLISVSPSPRRHSRPQAEPTVVFGLTRFGVDPARAQPA